MVDDEISLFDLYAILVRRKWVIVGTTVLVVALAAAWVLTRPVEYTVTAPLQIARAYVPEAGLVPVESPQSVAAKVQYGYGLSAQVQGEVVVITASGSNPDAIAGKVRDVASDIQSQHQGWLETVAMRSETGLVGALAVSRTGPGIAMVLSLALFIGAILGVVVSFVSEFVTRAHQHCVQTQE